MPKKNTDVQKPAAKPVAAIERVAEDLLTIDGRRYRVVNTYKQPFDLEAFANRYTEILEKYDYIVGDWGYDQLRLKGFYDVDSRHASKDQTINTLMDYLNEYCNFGCAYFVLQRLDAPETKPKRRPHRDGNRSRRRKRANKPYQERKTGPTTSPRGRAETVGAKPRQRHFTIRQRETDSE
ncbi:YutD family protein [Lacticaseibacillus sp. GG6-2]